MLQGENGNRDRSKRYDVDQSIRQSCRRWCRCTACLLAFGAAPHLWRGRTQGGVTARTERLFIEPLHQTDLRKGEKVSEPSSRLNATPEDLQNGADGRSRACNDPLLRPARLRWRVWKRIRSRSDTASHRHHHHHHPGLSWPVSATSVEQIRGTRWICVRQSMLR